GRVWTRGIRPPERLHAPRQALSICRHAIRLGDRELRAHRGSHREGRVATGEAPVTQPEAAGSTTIDRLFRLMCERGASDLHLCVGMPPLVRKDGEIQPLEPDTPALTPDNVADLLDPIMPEKNCHEFEKRHDTDFAHEISGLARFRANVFMDRKG